MASRIGPVCWIKQPFKKYPPVRESGRRYVPIHNLYSLVNLNPFQAIFELINTEGAYVRDLQLIVEVCRP